MDIGNIVRNTELKPFIIGIGYDENDTDKDRPSYVRYIMPNNICEIYGMYKYDMVELPLVEVENMALNQGFEFENVTIDLLGWHFKNGEALSDYGVFKGNSKQFNVRDFICVIVSRLIVNEEIYYECCTVSGYRKLLPERLVVGGIRKANANGTIVRESGGAKKLIGSYPTDVYVNKKSFMHEAVEYDTVGRINTLQVSTSIENYNGFGLGVRSIRGATMIAPLASWEDRELGFKTLKIEYNQTKTTVAVGLKDIGLIIQGTPSAIINTAVSNCELKQVKFEKVGFDIAPELSATLTIWRSKVDNFSVDLLGYGRSKVEILKCYVGDIERLGAVGVRLGNKNNPLFAGTANVVTYKLACDTQAYIKERVNLKLLDSDVETTFDIKIKTARLNFITRCEAVRIRYTPRRIDSTYDSIYSNLDTSDLPDSLKIKFKEEISFWERYSNDGTVNFVGNRLMVDEIDIGQAEFSRCNNVSLFGRLHITRGCNVRDLTVFDGGTVSLGAGAIMNIDRLRLDPGIQCINNVFSVENGYTTSRIKVKTDRRLMLITKLLLETLKQDGKLQYTLEEANEFFCSGLHFGPSKR